MENNQNQYIANVVKLSINPIKVVKHLDNNEKETLRVTEMPTRREVGIFLKHDPDLISDWYVEEGYHCIEISNIGFKEIDELTQSEYFFLGHLVYVNYLSEKSSITAKSKTEVQTLVGLFRGNLRTGIN